MKIRNLLFILLFLSANLEAQFVFVPDSNFRKFIKLQIGSTAIVGDSLDTTNTNLLSLHLLSVNDWALAGGHISDIESIQYFKNVDSLFFTCLLITNLNKFPPKISFLNYSYSSSHQEINNIPSSVRILE